jgi:hypothetical protein
VAPARAVRANEIMLSPEKYQTYRAARRSIGQRRDWLGRVRRDPDCRDIPDNGL